MDRKISQKYFELMDLMSTYNHRVTRHLKYSLPINHLIVLYCLWKNGISTISEISQSMSISKQQLSPIIDKLVSRDFISKRVLPEDKRFSQIDLTENGREFLKNYRNEMKEIFLKQTSNLSFKEEKEFCKSIDCIKKVLLEIMEME